MHPFIEARVPQIRELCRTYGVKRLELFGSGARDDFDPDRSDVDFLVEWDPDVPAALPARRLELERALEALLTRRVDLVTMRSIRNQYLRAAIERHPRDVVVS